MAELRIDRVQNQAGKLYHYFHEMNKSMGREFGNFEQALKEMERLVDTIDNIAQLLKQKEKQEEVLQDTVAALENEQQKLEKTIHELEKKNHDLQKENAQLKK